VKRSYGYLSLVSLVELLWACTPIAQGPPPTKISMGSQQEIGVAHSTAFQIEGGDSIEQIFLDEGIWYRRNIGKNSEIQGMTGVVWGGSLYYYGVVGYRRYFTVEGLDTAIDIKVGGPFYAEIGIPLQKQVAERPLWLTAQPSYGISGFGSVSVPVGISWQPKEHVQINTMIGSRFVGENPLLFYWNAGASFPF